jgi:hypothetical protein
LLTAFRVESASEVEVTEHQVVDGLNSIGALSFGTGAFASRVAAMADDVQGPYVFDLNPETGKLTLNDQKKFMFIDQGTFMLWFFFFFFFLVFCCQC